PLLPPPRALSPLPLPDALPICRGLAAAFAESGFAVQEHAVFDESVKGADAVAFTVDCEDAWAKLAMLLDAPTPAVVALLEDAGVDRKSTRLNSSHEWISYAVFC